mmetsp:Transcript_25913/g.31945  ORF Transcript_25913/g.31945 Transcript_25913/m.31945 type:complete len:159 (+) Transcript_25913:156-632(+)
MYGYHDSKTKLEFCHCSSFPPLHVTLAFRSFQDLNVDDVRLLFSIPVGKGGKSIRLSNLLEALVDILLRHPALGAEFDCLLRITTFPPGSLTSSLLLFLSLLYIISYWLLYGNGPYGNDSLADSFSYPVAASSSLSCRLLELTLLINCESVVSEVADG